MGKKENLTEHAALAGAVLLANYSISGYNI